MAANADRLDGERDGQMVGGLRPLCCKQGVSAFVQCSRKTGVGFNLGLIVYLSCPGHKT